MDGNDGKVVCVTGATGYLAGHLINRLIEKGYHVRGTMRNVKDEKRVAHLTSFAENLGKRENLSFFQADLSEPGSFDEVVKGCDGVFHVANVVKLDSKDPEKDIIEPSVNGLKAVLSAMDKEPRVQCFVLTSSYAAIEVGIPKEERGPLTEADHNTAASVSWKPYSFSKVQTEKLAVEWSKERKEKNGSFRYASIHPPMILGPQLNGESLQSSSEVFEMILNGSYPFLPPLFFPMIDVRDCADAHVVCFEHPKAEGRYLTCNGHHWLMDLANFARETFPKYPIPSRTLYVWFFKFVGQFDKRMDKGLLLENTKECLHVDASKICKELGFEYKYSIKQATIDHCQSLIDHKLVKVIE